MTWQQFDEVVTYYYKYQLDDFHAEHWGFDHSSTRSICSATRSKMHPPDDPDDRYEHAWAKAEVESKQQGDYTVTGEYCLYTKIIYQDKTGLCQGDRTMDIGDKSTISEGWEYYNIVNNKSDGTGYTGAQTFTDTAYHSMENVRGKNRLAAIAKSWIENKKFAHTNYYFDMAYTKVWL